MCLNFMPVFNFQILELKEKREREKVKEDDDRRKRRVEIPRPREGYVNCACSLVIRSVHLLLYQKL